MVGRLLGVQPLLAECETKEAVLQAIPSVSLIHFAAHGNAERGEIAISPHGASDSIPQEEDYLLTMSDIFGVQVRTKLVVLSCCHSARGLVKAEGVLGIAPAFLASGARSVLVASWAIEDEATEQLMKQFYKHLARGESASESLHQDVKWLRSNGFPKPKQWAPFVLLGDNVTFDFTHIGKEEHKEDSNEAEKKQSDC
ncbi:tetratricopeptide repeat protein 28-like [Stylophora pistillata]|uniref:tetratricopeptide repeat protein 28-like n=1 Tax=Stylophora pistillata TaxID=50429 RepID=UPI000C042E44|nr:tetratricopeptide repeat protein 28-like [Stylophora pistillata]